MTRVATRNVLDRTHLIRFLERVAERNLIVVTLAVENDIILAQRVIHWRLIAHIEDLLPRPQIFFRVPMAVQAKFHLQRRVLVDVGHLVDRTVAGIAPDALIDMDTVIEIHKVRHLVDARPLDRASTAEAFAHRSEIRRIGPDLCVTVNTRLSRRDTGEA